MDFENKLNEVLNNIKDILLYKNKMYGNSALNPIRIFAKSDRVEQIKVRIDDKLNRLKQGHLEDADDTITDLLGYLILLKMTEK